MTLRLVARYAQACNLGRGDPSVVRHKLGVLREHCDRLGADFDSITKSTSISAFPIADGADVAGATKRARGGLGIDQFRENAIAGSPPDTRLTIGSAAAIAEWINDLITAGVDYIIVYIPGVAYDHEPLHRFAEEIMPQFLTRQIRPHPTTDDRRLVSPVAGPSRLDNDRFREEHTLP